MMKRRLAVILVLVLAISLMLPATASAASTYDATLTLSGPDKDGKEQSVSANASYLKADLALKDLVFSFGDLTEPASNTFPGCGLSEKFAEFYDAAKTGSDEEWAAKIDETTITPEAVIPVIKDRSNTVADLVAVSESFTAKFDAYTVTMTFTSHSSGGASGGGGGSSGGSTTTKYKVNINEAEDGSVKASKTEAKKGDTVVITLTPDADYQVSSVAVADKDGKKVDVVANSDGTYSFKMPGKDVWVSAEFEEIEKEPEPEPVKERPFKDVAEKDWFYDAVYYCFDKGYFKGTDTDTFSPYLTMTRAMFATVLYRIAGTPAVTASLSFDDVESGTWYYDAVIWAASEGIIQGYGDGRFGTNDPVSREQMVVMLWRYSGSPAADTAALSSFSDADQISSWAIDAVAWAISEGIINGKGEGVLDPGTSATRAEVAQILKNYDKYLNA